MFFKCSKSVMSSLSFSISFKRRRFSWSKDVFRLADNVSYLLFHTSTYDFFWLISLANFSFSDKSWVLCLRTKSILSSKSPTFFVLFLRTVISSTRLLFSLSKDRMICSSDSTLPELGVRLAPVFLNGLVLDRFIVWTIWYFNEWNE